MQGGQFSLCKLRLQASNYGARQFVRHVEHVFAIAIHLLRIQVLAAWQFNEMKREAQSIADRADCTFDDVLHTELFAFRPQR